MKMFWEMGGVIAGVLLVAFGIGAIVIGFTGRSEVRDNIAREAICGSPDLTPRAIVIASPGPSGVRDNTPRGAFVGPPDMTPSAIKEEAAKAGLTNVDLP